MTGTLIILCSGFSVQEITAPTTLVEYAPSSSRRSLRLAKDRGGTILAAAPLVTVAAAIEARQRFAGAFAAAFGFAAFAAFGFAVFAAFAGAAFAAFGLAFVPFAFAAFGAFAAAFGFAAFFAPFDFAAFGAAALAAFGAAFLAAGFDSLAVPGMEPPNCFNQISVARVLANLSRPVSLRLVHDGLGLLLPPVMRTQGFVTELVVHARRLLTSRCSCPTHY